MREASAGLHGIATAAPPGSRMYPHGVYGTIAPYMGHVRRFLHNRLQEGADDLEQEVVLAIIEDPPRLTAVLNLKAFLLGMAKNQLRLHFRRRLRSARRDATALELINVLPEDDRSEIHLREADLSALPEPMRLVVHMTYWNGMTQPQVARTLGVPVGTVATRLRLAKGRLRALLVERSMASLG